MTGIPSLFLYGLVCFPLISNRLKLGDIFFQNTGGPVVMVWSFLVVACMRIFFPPHVGEVT